MSATVQIIPYDNDIPPKIAACWSECARTSSNFRACFQTPEWVEYRWLPAGCQLAILLDLKSADAIAVTPLARNTYQLPIGISGRRVGTFHFNGVLLIGSVPLFPPRFEHYDNLIEAIFRIPSVQALYVPGVPRSSPFWDYIISSQKTRSDLIFHPSGQDQVFDRAFYIEMPGTYEEYLRNFKSKTLQTFRRKMRLLEKARWRADGTRKD